MAELVAKRKVYVQSMRKAARACGVELILDTAGRARVVEFAQVIEDSSGPLATKQVAATALEKSAMKARVKALLKTRAAKQAARNYFASFRETCVIVDKLEGQHSGR